MLYGSAVLIYLMFILGLLLSNLMWGGWFVLGLGVIIAILRRSTQWMVLRKGPNSWIWILAGVVGLFASFYIQIRMPQASFNEVGRVSQLLQQETSVSVQSVEGKVETLPRQTRSGSFQIWISAKTLSSTSQDKSSTPQPIVKSVSGRLYVTLPKTIAQTVHPGQILVLEGRLYQPKPARNPAGFDFSTWLARQNSFSGMKAENVQILKDSKQWGLWQIRRRIVNAQQAWVTGPEGPLMGAMVLGNRAVDLPFDIQDAFIQVGLAHALAASGFQVSMILSAVLWLMRSRHSRAQFFAGSIALIVFAGLSGFQASVIRAVLMGFAGLISLILGAKMKPVSILIFIAFAMLIFNPLWIWDLGFQLSFLATLGLIVTVPSLQKKLEWVPLRISTLIAVPLAAMIWTLPLQLQTFGVIPTYALLANIVATPLISLVTLGGFLTGIVSVIFPVLGSALASLVALPCQGLIFILTRFNQLPGRTWALGSISIWQVVILYGLIVTLWLHPKWQKRWQLGLGIALLAAIVPIWTSQLHRHQLTIFDAGNIPIMVMQQPHSTVLVNTGNEQHCRQTVIPYLQHQGINQVDLAIGTDFRKQAQTGWEEISRRIKLGTFSPVSDTNPTDLQNRMLSIHRKIRWQPLLPKESARFGQAEVTVLRNNPPLLHFKLDTLNGIMITDRDMANLATWLSTEELPEIRLIWITSNQWDLKALSALNPETIIVSNRNANAETVAQLETISKQVYWVNQDGAVQWTPSAGFHLALPPGDGQSKLL